MKDLKREGYSTKQIQAMLPERKVQLAKALAEELNRRSNEETVSQRDAMKELELD